MMDPDDDFCIAEDGLDGIDPEIAEELRRLEEEEKPR